MFLIHGSHTLLYTINYLMQYLKTLNNGNIKMRTKVKKIHNTSYPVKTHDMASTMRTTVLKIGPSSLIPHSECVKFSGGGDI